MTQEQCNEFTKNLKPDTDYFTRALYEWNKRQPAHTKVKASHELTSAEASAVLKIAQELKDGTYHP